MTAKFTLTTLFELILVCNLFSQVTQEWVARHNGPGNYFDFSNAIALDDSGNIYVTGENNTEPYTSDFATLKYSSNGIQQWASYYNGPGDTDDVANSMFIDDSNYIYVCGKSFGNGTGYDFATIKYDLAGHIKWIQRFNSNSINYDSGECIAVDDSGYVYVVGNSNGDIAIIKYNSVGNLMWIARYHNPQSESCFVTDMVIDRDANIYITGNVRELGSEYDMVTAKFNSNGVQQWIKIYNGVHDFVDYSNAMAVDNFGSIYVTGETMEDPFQSDCITVRYDSNGNQVWLALYSGTADEVDVAYCIKVDIYGNIFVAGQSVGINTSTDCLIIKYNSAGTQLWATQYDGNFENDAASDIETDDLGNVYVTGSTQSTLYDWDYLTLKYNALGLQQWVIKYDGPAPEVENDYAVDIVLDTYGNVFVTGTSKSINEEYDFVTIKYSQPIGIKPISSKIPSQFSLSQNYPNPFNPTTKLRFDIPVGTRRGAFVQMRVYDLLGREVATLVNEQLSPGEYEVEWDASNFSSGVYYYRISANDFWETKKMILLK